MGETKTKKATRNFFWGLLGKIIGILGPLSIRTLIIYKLGTIYLGVGGLFSSILSFLSLAELGVGSAMVFSMYKPMAERNTDEINSLLALYKRLYRIIGIIVIVIGLIITPFIRFIINGDTPEGVNLYIVYLVYLVNTSLSYFMVAYKQSLFVADQRVDVVNILMMCSNLVLYSCQAIVLLVFGNFYAYVCMMIVGTIINNILMYVVSNRKYPSYHARGEVDSGTREKISTNVKALFLNKLGAVVRSAADNVVISAFLGLVIVGKYDNYFYIITSLMTVFAIVMDSICPSVGNLFVEGDGKKIRSYFDTFNILYVWMAGVSSIMFLCGCQSFIKAWAGEDNMLGIEIAISLAFYLYTHKFCDMLAVFQQAAGTWTHTKWIPLIAAVVNLVANIVLVQIIGLLGVVISTIISIVLVYDIGYADVLFKVLFKEKNGGKKYMLKQILLTVEVILVGFVCFNVCQFVVFSEAIIEFIIRLCISAGISVVILALLFLLHPDGKRAIKFVFNKLGIRRNNDK